MSFLAYDDANYKLHRDDVLHNIVEILKEIESPRDTKKFYHYTSAAGFYGIIKSKSLHAGDVLLMNDTAEITYAASLFIKTATCMSSDIQSEEYEILKAFFNKIRDAFVQKNPTTKFFVACFSEDSDELPQWRGYGGGRNGFAIEFDFTSREIKRDELVRAIPFKIDDSRRLIKVCYDEKVQLSVTRRLIEAFSIFCRALRVEYSCSSTFIASALDGIGHDVAMQCMLKLKHPAYHHEKEWRIVETRGIAGVPGGDLSLSGVQYKVSNNAVIPYIALNDLGNISRHVAHATGITGVRIGPREEIESFVEPTRHFLLSERIVVGVERSQVPLRY